MATNNCVSTLQRVSWVEISVKNQESWALEHTGELFFSLLGTLKSNEGEEILEGSTYSGFVAHESFTTRKNSVITYSKNVIHLSLQGCITFAKFHCTKNK